MTDQTTKAIDTSTEAVKETASAASDGVAKAAESGATLAKASANAADQAVEDGAKAVKAATAKTAKAAKSATARKSKTKTSARRVKTKAKRRIKRVQPQVETAAANERNDEMNMYANNWFAPFGGQTTPFQSMFADAGDRSQDFVRRGQKATEEFADLARANVEALVEAGRITVEGVRSISQDAVESGREGVEQAADAVRQLAEVKSATDFVQIQGELVRSSFDRMVSESSRLTESMVKLAGEAIQPISSRASVNAERLNKLVA